MSNQTTLFRPSPLILRVGNEDIPVGTLEGAIGLIRSLRHDRLGRFAEMLLAQMEAARDEHQQHDAWVAFETWSAACGLQPHHHGWRDAA
ncbi:MAG: hypothetical protein DI549_07690 [Ancylobacter novellus]|uniref:Uncharacterized protein n=1 Tax=Ancylobacter novellus TaxID=921 RepID=A0A2W5R4X5_ANCNO|nr:MAG: hypothetical protein DI549_07690 [Ancylobacter novellus]